jgi:hypothetical protein
MTDAYTAQEMKDLETRFSEEFKQYMEEARRGGESIAACREYADRRLQTAHPKQGSQRFSISSDDLIGRINAIQARLSEGAPADHFPCYGFAEVNREALRELTEGAPIPALGELLTRCECEYHPRTYKALKLAETVVGRAQS